MIEYKVGDKVRVANGFFASYPVGYVGVITHIGASEYGYGRNGGIWLDGDEKRDAPKWTSESYIERCEPVDKHKELTERINNLRGNSTLRELDDLAEDLYRAMDPGPSYRLSIPLWDGISNGVMMLKGMKHIEVATFPCSTQCTKLSAIQQALRWMLDNSSVKKKDSTEAVRKLEDKVRDIQEEIEKLK